MDDPVAGPPAFFEWNGLKWYRNAKDGYYRDSSGGVLLHIAVWVHANGRVPKGHDIHHLDHDRSHNYLSNLEVRTTLDHKIRHTRERVQNDPTWAEQAESEVARARSNRMWANRRPRTVVCEWCSVVFESVGMRTRFCGPKCAAAARRAKRRELLNTREDVRPHS